jgi:predicted nuclease of predicted toxin-antitoxin system
VKVLLDSCVWGGARLVIQDAGHEVDWAGDWPADPGDAEILRQATAAQAVLVTLDKDFGELAIVRRLRHTGVIRIVGFAAREQGPACVAALTQYGAELTAGALVTVERSRTRIRYRDADGS